MDGAEILHDDIEIYRRGGFLISPAYDGGTRKSDKAIFN
jgi:hypothetical protein